MSSGTASASPARTPLRRAIPDIVQQHLEEHGFLSLQRRKLLFSTEYASRRMPRHDERIAAHWAGLEVAGADAVKRALEVLDGGEDPWEIASAVRVWIELGRADSDAVLARLVAMPPEQSPSWREALRAQPTNALGKLLPEKRLGELPPPALAVVADAFAWNGALMPSLAGTVARHPEPIVRAALARHQAHAGAGAPESALKALLEDADPGVRRRALWSAALTAPDTALERARRAVRGTAPDTFAVRVLGLLGTEDDHDRIADAAGTDIGRPAAFWAFADLGTEAAVESLLKLLRLADEELVAVGAAALQLAIGRVPREDLSAPPTPEQAREHWEAVAHALPRGSRVLDGRPRPWRGEPGDAGTLWVWRAAIANEKRSDASRRREVPDGFFSALPAGDARPGE